MGRADHLTSRGLATVVGLAIVGLVGCGPSTRVPADAQQVHVSTSEADVHLEPSTARAGDVYLVLDDATESIVLVQRKPTAEATPGPLTDADLARLAQGDAQGTAMEGFETTGCDASQREADRGLLRVPGGCGNVFRLTLDTPGTYAILVEDPANRPPGSTPMAVLEILP